MLRHALRQPQKVSSIASGAPRCVSARACSTSPDIDVKKISVERTLLPKPKLPKEELIFGRTFSDHMFEVDWTLEDGWGSPRIVPYHALQIDAACSALHYSLQCFEGMKCYRDDDGNPRLFRPDLNAKRFHNSMKRLSLPGFDQEQLIKCIMEFCKLENKNGWIPSGAGYSLYLRPTAISTHPMLGVDQPKAAKIFVIASPVGPYFKDGFKPVRLWAQREFVRAWPGGTGDAKVGGNYGSTIAVQKMAEKQGFNQVLWLFGDQITEAGTANFFVLLDHEDGRRELVTAPLDGTILPGVTRQSILDLCRKWGEFDVSERTMTIQELADASKAGRVVEAFACGTAFIVSPVREIGYEGDLIDIPIDADLNAGKLTNRLSEAMTAIQYGKTDSPWSVLVA